MPSVVAGFAIRAFVDEVTVVMVVVLVVVETVLVDMVLGTSSSMIMFPRNSFSVGIGTIDDVSLLMEMDLFTICLSFLWPV